LPNALGGGQENHTLLQGTLGAKLVLGDKNIALVSFCNAYWVGDPNDKRFTMSYALKLRDSAIWWSSKKQPTVALFTSDAKYTAIS